MKMNRTWGAALAAVCAAALLGAAEKAPELPEGDYFTCVNLWYDEGKPIHSTNYHVGNRIPVGSRVSDLIVGRKSISFLFNGTRFELLHMKKFTLVPIEALKMRTFGKTDPLTTPAYLELTEAERKAVAEGRVEIGMSRDAVILSQGYPPEHKTPSLQQDVWTYWRNRILSFRVSFTGNRVSEITP